MFVLTLIILIGFFIFDLHVVPPNLILSSTQTVGGDTPEHYFVGLQYYTSLFPHGEITGWLPDQNLGFVALQFYFPLPFVLMSILGSLITYNVAFKIVTLLGLLLLPAFVYASLTIMGLRKPAPTIAAVLSQLLVLTEINVHNGVYYLDVLSGQFSESLSVLLYVLFLALVWRMLQNKKFSVWPGVTFGLMTLSHAMFGPFAAVVQFPYMLFWGSCFLQLALLRSCLWHFGPCHFSAIPSSLKRWEQTWW
jgi:hypothetical protein